MNLTEIKKAVDKGRKVYWKNELYSVVKDSLGQYLVKCSANYHCIGLTWKDGKTLNGEETDFYMHDFTVEYQASGNVVNLSPNTPRAREYVKALKGVYMETICQSIGNFETTTSILALLFVPTVTYDCLGEIPDCSVF